MLSRIQHLERRTRNGRRLAFADQELRPAVHRRKRVPELVIHHREEPLPRALQLMYLLQQPGTLLVMTRDLHRSRSLRREQNRDVLVFLGKRIASDLLAEIQISEGAATSENRDAQK